MNKKTLVTATLAGFIFALGLGLSGMTQPQKVIAFLDPWNWDPSLLFVMAGAIGIHAPIYRMIRKRNTPFLESQWHVPSRNDISASLCIGSLIFGIGWGLGGYCPGPGVVSVMSGDPRAIVFTGMMMIGMLASKMMARKAT